jgi:hypothetical protein
MAIGCSIAEDRARALGRDGDWALGFSSVNRVFIGRPASVSVVDRRGFLETDFASKII